MLSLTGTTVEVIASVASMVESMVSDNRFDSGFSYRRSCQSCKLCLYLHVSKTPTSMMSYN